MVQSYDLTLRVDSDSGIAAYHKPVDGNDVETEIVHDRLEDSDQSSVTLFDCSDGGRLASAELRKFFLRCMMLLPCISDDFTDVDHRSLSMPKIARILTTN